METLWSAFCNGGYDSEYENNCTWNIYDRSNHLLCRDYGKTTGNSDLINTLDKCNVHKITKLIKGSKRIIRVTLDVRYSLNDAHNIVASAQYSVI